MKEQIEEFNRTHVVDMNINYKDDDGSTKTAAIRFPAELLNDHTPVVWVKGRTNALHLNNVIK